MSVLGDYEHWKQCEEKAQKELQDLGVTGQALDTWYRTRVEELFALAMKLRRGS